MSIAIGRNFTITSDGVATQTFGILAVRGAGKSNLAAVMAEGMYAEGLPFVVVDPVGAWWGLRSSGSGSKPGLQVLIFGGRHGDVPLERSGGQVIADLVVDERVSCVLDISDFSEGDKTHFLIDFAERLYRRNTAPLHLFLEEADDYCPQRPFREQARLLRAWENLVRRGRSRGLGVTMITQRSAALNKNVLTQIETLFVLRTTSPQDRKAIAGWIEYRGEQKEILESLPGLENGEAWVWSPSWLKVMKRIHVRRRETFDSGATPKHEKGARPAARMADVDLESVAKRMEATIERAKLEDPRELRKRIAELEREKAKPAPVVAPAKPVKRVTDAQVARIEKASDRINKAAEKAYLAASNACEVWINIQQTLGNDPLKYRPYQPLEAPGKANPDGPKIQINPAAKAVLKQTEPYEWGRAKNSAPAGGTVRVRHGDVLNNGIAIGNTGAKRMMVALAQHPAGLTGTKLSILTGIAKRGGTWRTYLARIRGAGFVETNANGWLRITPSGMKELERDEWEPMPTGIALAHYWLARLGDSGKTRILQVLLDAHPNSLPARDVAARAGIDLNGGTWRTYLAALRGLELVEGSANGLRASDVFFGG